MGELRSKIFSLEDIKKEKITIEEWGIEIEVRELTAEQRANIYALAYDKGRFNIANYYGALIIEGCYDPETGEKIFKPADLQLILKKSGKVIEKIAMKIAELSGLTEGSVREADINFQITTNWNSTSTLPNNSGNQSENY